MREIKLRVWNITTKRMDYLESTTENHNHYLQVGSGGFWLYESANGKLMANSEAGDILLQFTGRSDLNNKQIYEGDLIQYGEGDVRQVSFVGHSFGILNKDNSFGSHFTWVNGTVVGNIYETPELLNPKY